MPSKGSLNVVEQHLEKALLGLAGLALIGVGVYYFGLKPNRVDYKGAPRSANEIDDAIAEQVRQLEAAFNNPPPPKPVVIPEYAALVRREFESGIFKPDPNNTGMPVPAELPLTAHFGKPLPSIEKTGAGEENIELVSVLPPGRPVARTGISMVVREEAKLEPSAATPGPKTGPGPGPTPKPTGEGEGISWVTVGAYFPIDALKREMTAKGYAGHRARVDVVSVDAQRQELLPTGDWSEWKDVPRCKAMPKAPAPAPVFDSVSGSVLNQADLDSAFETIRTSQVPLMQPHFYPWVAGDPWMPPPLPGLESELTLAAKTEDAPAEKKPKTTGGRSSGGPLSKEDRDRIRKDLDEARAALRAGKWDEAVRLAETVQNNERAARNLIAVARKIVEKAKKEKEIEAIVARGFGYIKNPNSADEDPAVWVHDDSVEPGKTYRYRLRVEIWNRYVGRRAALRDPAQAEKSVLVGEWSEPGDPVAVDPKSLFFVKSKGPGADPAASVDVFAWYAGNWFRESFTVGVGDAIGEPKEIKVGDGDDGKPQRDTVDFATRAVVLDIRPEESVWTRRSTGKGEFAYSDQKGVVVVYLDPVDGQVKQRFDRSDRVDSKYAELKDETEEP